MPYVKLAGSKAREGRSGLARRVFSVVVAGALAALVGFLGAPEPAQAIPEQTVSTVSPSGTTINLFDYWTTDAQPNSISGNSGINSGHQLQFNGGGGDGINGWSGSGAPTSYVSSTLSDDGYPQITAGTHGSDRSGRRSYTSESLAYLFDWSTRPGKEAHLGVKGLLQTIGGYYEYDSQHNFASYDAATNSFKVYDSPAVTYDGPAGKFNGMFFPFNSASQVNANTSAESSTLNHHFGLSMSTQFIQPAENGVAGMTDYNGSTRDMEFEFSGDDDVWVYIDDVLVGDLGGIHDLAKLNINFRTGDVKVNDKSVGTLKSLFEAAGVSTGNFSGDTFAADSQHTLKFYYLERGAAASNMHLKFNLVTQPVSELLKIDQNGNPVQGAKFELCEANENYNVSGDPIATGTTDANGQLYFTNVNDHSVISFDKEADAGTTHFVLKEIGVPDGYHSSVTSHDGTMHLEYVRSQHEGGSSGGTLQSPTDTQDGFTVNRRWLNGGHVASKETLTAPSDLRAADGSSAIKPSTSKGTMFAVVYMKDDDGTWKALVGDAVNGYKTVGNGDLAGAIEAVRQQGGSTFALTTSGQYQVELNDLPGDARDYAYMMASDQMANAKYTVAVYYTTANTLDGATEDNTVRVDTDNFTRQFAAKLLVTNVQNRLFVQKVDEGGNPVDGATFSLYSASSVETDAEGIYRLTDGAEAIDSATTAARTFPYTLDGSACFPVDSANKKPLENGTYYLAETAAPDGYLANDTVTKVIVDDTGVYVDAGKEGDGVRSMSGPGSLLSTMSQYGTNDEVDQTLASIKGTLESATEGQPSLVWGPCTAKGVTPADVNDHPMKMGLDTSESSEGNVLQYVKTDGGGLPIIYADTGINRMKITQDRIIQDDKPFIGDNLGDLQLNQLFTSATGVEYTDKRLARLEVTKQVTSADGMTAPTTYVDAQGQTQDLTFEFTFRLPTNGIPGGDLANKQEYDAQVFDAAGNAVGTTFKLRDGSKHAIKAGETIRVYGLSAGDQFSVTETGKHEDLGFSLVSRKKGNEEQQGEGDAISGKIVETTSSGDISQNNRLTFTNNYSPIPATLDGSASLRVTKSLVNEDGSARDWDEGDAFTFTLAPGDEATADAVKEGLITLPDNASGLVISRDAANHASEFGDITFKVAGTFTFDVAESRGADAKPSTAYDTGVKHVRVSVADKGNGQLAASVERSSDTLAFTNIYKTPKKVYRAGDDAKASIDGQTVSAGDKITYELAWVNNTGADARVSVTDTLPQGVEFVSASDGGTPSADGTAVTWDLGQQPTDAGGTVTLTVRVTGVSDEAGTDEIANTAKVTVGENSYDTNTVTVKAEKCSLEISKTVEGGDPNREFTFDVTLGNADGTPFAGTLGAKRYSEGQDTPEDVSVTFDAEGKAQLTLKAGQRIVVSRLSKSARYTVREQPAAGYTATVNGQDGSEATGVLDSGVTSVSFNNAYATDTYVAHTDNLFSKTLVGRDWADGESFSFTMTLAQGDASGVTYNGSATASKPASGNKATFGFGDMTFTRPGTYVFDVTEDGASAAGLKKDTHTATLTVTVRDDGLGHLVVDGAVPVIVSDGDFTNTYSSNLYYGVAGGLKLEKTLDGHAMAAGQFQFTLKAVDEDGAVAASESAALLGLPEAGKVFDSPASDDGVAAAVNLLPDDGLVLTQANANKTYAFELTETRGGGAGYTNDSQVHKVRIAVTDDGAGTLTATTTVDGTAYVYKTGDSGVENPAKVYLTNSYQASGEATIKAEKVLRGRDQVAGEFHFTVTDKQGSTVATGTNAADGAITFDKPLSYTQADVGTHAYTVTETGNLPSGVRGIVTQLAVEVSVTDNGDGTLRASVAYPDDADHLTFVNEYGADASASVSLNGTKSYDAPAGEGYATPDIEGKFAFTLTGADGAPMPSGSDGQAKTVRNAAGNVDFGEVAYTMADAGKTYEYTIAEAATDDSPKGVSVDGGTRVVRVSVTDNGDGTISATATDGDGNSLGTGSKFSFTNAYCVKQTSATIQGTKSLEGRELRDGEFTFELLEDGRQVAMTSNDAEGRFSFDLTYDKPGEHEYVVREVVPGETRGVSFDTHEAVAHVSVSDNGAGALVANVTYPGGDVSFKNTYAAEGTSARIVAVKRLEGATLADGQFTFQLSDAETGTVLQSATNAADGSVTFALGYGAADAGKTFTYKVSERNDGQAGVTYDGSSYTVKVEVTDDGEGHLSAKASTDDCLVFTNRYDAGGSGENPSGSPDVETPPAKQLPQTSDPLADTAVEATLAVVGIIVIAAAILVRRRHR